jgi:hypothetical protein
VPDFISPARLPEFSLDVLRTLNHSELSVREKVSVFRAFESPNLEKESLSREIYVFDFGFTIEKTANGEVL